MSDKKHVTTMIDLKHSPWSSYHGNSVGRVIHYLYYYLGINYADSVTVSSTEVTYWGKKIADLSHDMGYPVFIFTDNLPGDLRWSASRKQDAAMDAQVELGFLMEDFRRVMDKALEYAEKDKVFLHNKNCLLDIKRKYFKEL